MLEWKLPHPHTDTLQVTKGFCSDALCLFRELLGWLGSKMSTPTTPEVILWRALRKHWGPPTTHICGHSRTYNLPLSPSADSTHTCSVQRGVWTLSKWFWLCLLLLMSEYLSLKVCVLPCANSYQHCGTNRPFLFSLELTPTTNCLNEWLCHQTRRSTWESPHWQARLKPVALKARVI